MSSSPEINKVFAALPDDTVIVRTANQLTKNGMMVHIVEDGPSARKKALELIPIGSEVMNMTSTTVSIIGLEKHLMDSGKYILTKKNITAMDQTSQEREIKRAGCAPEWSVGSVHAISETGSLFIASQSGSQLAAHSYSAKNVLFLAGAQKIVKDFETAMKRIYEYSYPLEDRRALEVYKTHSSVNKILVINKETVLDRINIILIKQNIGF